MLQISILINKMTNKIMTFNEFMAQVAGRELIEYRFLHLEGEILKEEKDKYYAGEYEIHLYYLIETWKNCIDENFEIDYERQGTFYELWNYSQDFPCFQDRWVDDIFERNILDTNIYLK